MRSANSMNRCFGAWLAGPGVAGVRHALFALVCLTIISATISASAVAEAAQQTWQLNLSGRGFGHGVGMSQWGAKGLAESGKAHRDILRHYYRGISFSTTANRTVRVLLTSNEAPVRITSAGAFTAQVGGTSRTIAANVTASVSRTGGLLKLTAGGSTWTSAGAIVFRPGGSQLRLVNRNLNGWSTTANALYRGSLTVDYRAAYGLHTVNSLALEGYLRGVVPREMPSSWSQQALRAQAVAARTFAAKRLGGSGPFDLYCDTRSQVYGGAGGETAATSAAVSATAGVVATYGGALIDAFYFSSSGGRTENSEHVWSASRPYLKSVADPYDTGSPYHAWPENPLRWSGSAVRAQIGAASLPAGGLQALYVVKRGASPRVVRALGVSASGATALAGTTLRTRLGLRSTWFDVRSMSIIPGEGASVAAGERVTLRGRTYPALASGATLKLFYLRDGIWRSVNVPAGSIARGTRTVAAAGASYTLRYSTYSYTVRPPATTIYRFGVASSRSPQATVKLATAEPAVGLGARALRNFGIRRARRARFRFRVDYAAPAGETTAHTRARVVLKVRDAGGRSRHTKVFPRALLNRTLTYRIPRCWLKKGTYRYFIYATLPDGTTQQKVGSGRLTIR